MTDAPRYAEQSERSLMRSAFKPNDGKTHWDGCEYDHPWCGMAMLLDACDHLQAKLDESAAREAALSRLKAERDAYREDAEKWKKIAQEGGDKHEEWCGYKRNYIKLAPCAIEQRERADALQRENAALREVAEAAKHVANDPEWRRLVRTGDMSNLQRTLAQLRADAPEEASKIPPPDPNIIDYLPGCEPRGWKP